MKGKRRRVDRRGGKTISKSEEEWILPAQIGQLKTGIVANSSLVPRRPSKVLG